MLLGFIGLGNMGYAMAARLREAGYELIVWNRSREKAERFSKEYGAEVARSPKEVGERADYVHIMVSDVRASMEVILNGIALSSRKVTVIEHSTLTPSYTQIVSQILKSKSMVFAEAPVIGGPRQAREGKLLVLLAGPHELTDSHMKALGEIIYLGEVPKAAAVKLAFNLLFLSSLAGIAEAFSIVEAYGVSYKKFFKEVVSKTWISPVVERYLERGFRIDAPPSFRLRLAAKDAAYAAEALREAGLPAYVSSAAASLFSDAVAEGWGNRDYSTVIGFNVSRVKKVREK